MCGLECFIIEERWRASVFAFETINVSKPRLFPYCQAIEDYLIVVLEKHAFSQSIEYTSIVKKL